MTDRPKIMVSGSSELTPKTRKLLTDLGEAAARRLEEFPEQRTDEIVKRIRRSALGEKHADTE